jgi:hypothetical protein
MSVVPVAFIAVAVPISIVVVGASISTVPVSACHCCGSISEWQEIERFTGSRYE